MRNRLVSVFMLMIVTVLIASCGGGGGGAAYTASPTGILRLHNSSGVTIDHAYLSPSDSPDWGLDQLTGPLPTGLFFDLLSIPVGTYDGMAEVIGYYSDYYGYLYSIPISKNTIYDIYADANSFTGSLEVVNGTAGAHITQIYVAPSSDPSWGYNQISIAIGPGSSLHLNDMPPGSYDVKVVWNIGDDTILYNETISSLTLLTLRVI